MLKIDAKHLHPAGLILSAAMWVLSLSFCYAEVDWKRLQTQNAETIRQLQDDSPFLRDIYAQYFLRTPNSVIPEWYSAARNDLKDRGNRITPILLDLFRENPEGAFQAGLLNKVGRVLPGEVPVFKEAALKLFHQEGMKLPVRTIYALGWFLSEHGAKEDLLIFDEMLEHPNGEVALVLPQLKKTMQKRLGHSVATIVENPRAKREMIANRDNSMPRAETSSMPIDAQQEDFVPQRFGKGRGLMVLVLTGTLVLIFYCGWSRWRKAL